MTVGYTVAQAARLVAALRWAAGCVADLLGAWAGEASPDSPEAAMWMATAGRRLAWHCESLEGLQPDSVRMERYRDPAPPDPRLPAAVAEIAGLSGAAARQAVARHVLIAAIVKACDEVCAQAAAHCDAALASAAEAMGRDLQRPCHNTDGVAGASLEPVAGAVAQAERALASAGGLVPRSLLRPDSNS